MDSLDRRSAQCSFASHLLSGLSHTLWLALLALLVLPAAYAQTATVLNVGSPGGVALLYPSGVAVDGSGDVFIADTGNNRIVEVAAGGAVSVLTTNATGLNSPTSVAVNSSGDVYIADAGDNRVVEVAGGVASVLSTGSLTLLNPTGVALDSSGNVYIADWGNDRVVEVTSGGSASVLSLGSPADGTALYEPFGAAVSSSESVYVADGGNNRVVTMAGSVLSLGSLTLNQPQAVAVDSSGDVFIADTFNSRVVEVASGGAVSVLGTGSLTAPSGIVSECTSSGTVMCYLAGVAVYGTNNVYIADTYNHRVVQVTLSGTPTVATPSFSPAAGTYTSSATVTISDATSGATIYYTTNGTTPTTSSIVYSSAITVSATETLEAIATHSGDTNSAVGSAAYTIQVATPTFSPAAGTYSSAQTVTISDGTSGATIYYTTNGTTPTTSSSVYSSAISVSATETLEAIATHSGDTQSVVGSAAYTITQPAATPAFSPAAGTYTGTQTVTISDGTSGATIYYTTNGTTPTTNSSVYSSAIGVSATETLEAIATASGYSQSAVGSAAYTIKVNTPTFSPVAGTYSTAQTVTISDATSGATIYYTTNGTTPTTSSSVYSSAITVSATETLEALATHSGDTNSAVGSAAYTISSESAAATPTFSPAAGTYSSAQTVTISDGTSGATIYYTTNGTTPTTSSSVYSSAITVSSTETVEAIATASGYLQSAVGSAAYTISSSNGEYEWTWMGGSTTIPGAGLGVAGVYGTEGTFASGNIPGGRNWSTGWTDSSYHVWLFGGRIPDSSGNLDYINDLWEYIPSTNEWAWMSGSSTANQSGVYGTLGTAASGNIPGGRSSDISWIDSSGNLWLFGGLGYDSAGTFGDLNDLWKYTPSTGLWTWMGGSNTANKSGVYGTEGTAASGNIPGSRYGASSWTDSSGNFWFFGANGYDSAGNVGNLNDLWKYTPSTGLWTWMGGSNTEGASGVYGTLGTAASGNIPGSRNYAVSWIDGSGNLWLSGGNGADSVGTVGSLNDLWKYSPSSNEWTWESGSSTIGGSGGQTGVYGTEGTPAAGNVPGGRSSAMSWIDRSGNLWLLGGYGFDSAGTEGDINDLWEFNPSTAEWTWMGGSNTVNKSGVYGTEGTAAPGNIPGARAGGMTWIDASGYFWLFGGHSYDSAGTFGYINDLWEYQPTAPTVATPTFSPAAGTYSSAQTVTISDGTSGATIYYTTNGTTPTTSSTVYSSAITVSATETVEALATHSGDTNSVVGSAAYTINLPVVATPTFSPAAGTYTAAQTVTISDGTSGATIYYTTNGTTPTTGSTVYSSAITVSATETVKALATHSGDTNSAVGSAAYTIQVATPTFSPAAGTYSSAQTVTISDGTSGATIYYTTNGTTPTTGSTVYSSAITVSATETVEALATHSGDTNSAVGSAAYTISSQVATPTFSPAAGTYTAAQTVTISDGTSGATIYYTTNGTTPTTGSTVYSSAITVSATETVEALATHSGDTNSAVGSAAYTIQVATPTFSPAAGSYTGAQTVTISDATSGATIYYTTNGTTPTTGSTVYSSAITVSATETVEALATHSGDMNSAVGSAAYTIQVTTPTFSPAAGTYTSSATVTISDATSGATIYYTTNGTTPTTGSAVYSSAITVSATETVKALATHSGNTNSAVGSAAYTIQVATPTFSPAGGSYTGAQTVTISDATSGATIYYTTNGTTPTTGSAVYSAAIAVSTTETVEALATHSGDTNSAVSSAAYTIQVNTPAFSPVAGTYSTAQTVTISDGTSGATIYYTINGTTPTTGSTVYSAPITVAATETLEALATHSGDTNSAVSSAAYTFEWTWISGSSTVGTNGGQFGVYGTEGTPAAGNVPGGRQAPATWADSSGNLWFFGGAGFGTSGSSGNLNDLWKFTPSTSEWTWMGGSSSVNASGVYGTEGTPAAGNIPGSRTMVVNWIDSSGNLWLFGGWDSAGALNDLWKYSPSSNEWTWMGGSSSANQDGVYGTLGTAASGNVPGARGNSIGWIDSSGNLWLFGGYGFDSVGTEGDLNDLWKYSPSANEWTWVSGSNTIGSTGGQPGVYGTLGTPASGNVPGGRDSMSAWIDGSGNFWVFGGEINYTSGSTGYFNDLWKFNPSTTQWTWMAGSNTDSTSGVEPGVYGTEGTPAAGNVPGQRDNTSNWIDSSGNLWLFGGLGYDSASNQGDLNDLWKFVPSLNEWTWMGGSNTVNHDGVYGTLGTPASGNIPGSRLEGSNLVDHSGNIWLFGGSGLDSVGSSGLLNDLWKF
jgi:N-acetylneuraminic acid mutarotase